MTKKPRAVKSASRKQQRDLDIEIRFMEGVVRRDPSYVDALEILGDDYTRRGKFREGLVVDKRLAKLKSKDCNVHYNLACSYALLGKAEKACDSLEKAITLGYRDFRWMSRDPDLRGIRKHPRYKQVRALVKIRQIKID